MARRSAAPDCDIRGVLGEDVADVHGLGEREAAGVAVAVDADAKRRTAAMKRSLRHATLRSLGLSASHCVAKT